MNSNLYMKNKYLGDTIGGLREKLQAFWYLYLACALSNLLSILSKILGFKHLSRLQIFKLLFKKNFI